MAEINNYIYLSKTATSINNTYITEENFKISYMDVQKIEQESFLRYLLINNVPFAFRNKPILFEQIIQYLSEHLNLSPNNIKLIGSAKTGFSISPFPNYGKQFDENSDLDFSIVDEFLFSQLEREFYSWADQYTSNLIQPFTINQQRYWPENLKTCSRTIKRGFIDVYKIPAYNEFYKTQMIYQSMFLIQDKLNKVHSLVVKRASVRVYNSWRTFSRQLKLNTESVLKTLV